ncbi:RND family efflux transporter [marine gamma proteobacterium HTCC2143]|jgi:multidrug efflux pump|uniref:RND family efflux transporter n=1 Tax=marine gamma proteobacterium HTCC2143 TaxID=247633 RepID=A0YBR9_9GAMM|nr:RND family efflux transporter [marine gamma proteobacterium HTCC2143]
MLLPELSVKRPVFATVIALLLAAFGAMAFNQLSTREYPDVSPPLISISTEYAGAAADVIETRITQIIEDEISGIDGVKSVRSSSQDGRSNINIEFDLNRDIDAAANDIRDKVSRVINRLPEDAEQPRVQKSDSDAYPIIYISLEAASIPVMELTDYTERYIVDRFAVLPGVASVNVYSSGTKSMRVWIDRKNLAARQLTVSDVVDALRQENIELPAGRIESTAMEFPIRLQRSYRSEKDFRELVLKVGDGGQLVRLGDVAKVEVGSSSSRFLFITNGSDSMAMGIVKQSKANTVDVLAAINKEVEAIARDLPEGMAISTSGDASAFIRAALNGVYWAIFLTTGLVALVILLFLGNLSATLIPVVCIPLSLMGAMIALEAFGFSINLITLLAMVLAIGLVVDDAIVVLENIYRRIEKGEAPLLAAYKGASQVGFAVIATTVVLVAVFTPIVFMQDNMGRIFSELAVAICAAVIVSSIMALSIVPMMCGNLLKANHRQSAIEKFMLPIMSALETGYIRSLRFTLTQPWVPVIGTIIALGTGYYLAANLKTEYAPIEDQDTIFVSAIAQEGTGVETMRGIIEQLQAPVLKAKEQGGIGRVLFLSPGRGGSAPTNAFSRISLVPWNERDFSVFDFRDRMVSEWEKIPGIRVMAFLPSGISRGGPDSPIQFVIQGQNFSELANWRDEIMIAADESGLFGRLNSDLKETQQQIHISVDRNRAAALGVSVREIGETLQALMTDQQVSTYSDDGEEYPVIVQLQEDQRVTPGDISNVYVRSSTTGKLIQLSNLLQIRNVSGIAKLNRYNRMRSVTISGGLAPGVSLGEALQFLEETVRGDLPNKAKIDYKGQSLEYKESSTGIYFTFGFALVVLFLVMAAQFESFVHPTVIMITVPLALVGGMLGLMLSGQSLNIFSQIGLLMLIGIATKNGILIVEFINQVRDTGVEFTEAIIKGCQLRLRPVLMTTISTLVGAMPLVLMSGPGSVSRNVLGVVILSGVSLATLLTLFMVPGLYKLIAGNTGSPERLSRELKSLQDAESENQ